MVLFAWEGIKMTIEEAIEKSGTKNILAKSSTKYAQRIIQPNEEVLYAINTNVVIDAPNKTLKNKKLGGVFNFKGAINGVIVITDKRILFCNSLMGSTNQKQILIKDIQSIDENINGLTKTGQLRICGITDTFLINIYKKNIGEEIKQVIYNLQTKESHSNYTSSISQADEIMKFKKLLDEGIITQEEFEKKKQELLK